MAKRLSHIPEFPHALYENSRSGSSTPRPASEPYNVPEVHVELAGYSHPVDDHHDYAEVIYSDDALKTESTENFSVVDVEEDGGSTSAGDVISDRASNFSDNKPKPEHEEGKPERDFMFVDKEGTFTQPAPARYLLADKVIEDELDKDKVSAIYANKRTLAQGMLDIALLTANTSQLRVVLQSDEHISLRKTMIGLISLSIALQVVVGLCLIYIGTLDKDQKEKKRRANILNNVVTMFIFIITIINVMVSSFGLENMQHVVRVGHAPATAVPAPATTLPVSPPQTQPSHINFGDF